MNKGRKIKMSLGELRRVIRDVLSEGPSGPGVTADPTEIRGFYPYETERGVDILSTWYRSPGAAPGSSGDPGRPADPAEYIGFKTKGATPEDAAAAAAPPPESGEGPDPRI
jgi:hypothetical protein